MTGRKWRTILTCCAIVALAVVLAACARPSDTPPPEEAQRAYDHIREGYTAGDPAVLTQAFAEIMFTGRTVESYGEVIEQLKAQLGEWGEGVYYGEDDGQHTWQVTFEKGKARVLIVLDDEGRVTGLWFR